MAVECECTQCGGKDEFAWCENGMLENQVSVWKSEKLLSSLVIAFIISIGICAILGI